MAAVSLVKLLPEIVQLEANKPALRNEGGWKDSVPKAAKNVAKD